MKTLWNDETAATATGGEARGHWHASRVEIDSRRVQLGDLFVAIKGERVDGHHYVADALARGAVAAVVSHVPEGLPRNASLLLVKDTLEALVAMGKFARARSHAKIVGVTGSVGKTSAKEMLKLALSTHGKTYATTGNFNNHIGTPLNLANFPPDAAFGVFEMGMNHADEIRHLVEMVRPHVAVITNVEAVHLEFFKDVQAIADAKAEIFEHTAEHGAAVLPADNAFCEYLRRKAGHLRVLTFGEKESADARLLAYEATVKGAEIVATIRHCHPVEGRDPALLAASEEKNISPLAAASGSRVGSSPASKCGVGHGMTEETLSFAIGATGKHFATTALATLSVAQALGLPLPKTAAALADYTESEGRGKLRPLALSEGRAWLIDDSYNASPASMRAAIAKADEVWRLQGGRGRKIAALGDMLELGKDAPQLHAALAESLVAHGFHLVFTAGALMQHLSSTLPNEMRGQHVPTAKALLPVLQKTLQPDDVLLIKGSHGSKMYELALILRDANASAQDRHIVGNQ